MDLIAAFRPPQSPPLVKTPIFLLLIFNFRCYNTLILLMEKKAKIIATLGPSIFSDSKLKKIIDSGVDAFRINFSHNISGIGKIISKIRKIEKKKNKKITLIADLQGVKLRIGNIKNQSQKIKYNQRFVFDCIRSSPSLIPSPPPINLGGGVIS